MRSTFGVAAVLALALPAGGPAAADEALLEADCGACHSTTEAGLTRIAGQRKTPEGWLMTIVRMRLAHDAEITDADQAELVRYLADTQGLAPSETEGWRYALEKDPNVVEAVEEPLASMCARCHTAARAMLQRRTPEEWLLHVDFHVGQFPTIEYQALGRDREWYRIARDEIAPMLAEMLPLETDAWDEWQAADWPDVTGDWVALTELAGRGDAYGRFTVSGDASPYEVEGEFRLADGTALPVSGQMNLYTGYEWRGNISVDGVPMRQVLALSEDGARLEGRQFQRDQDSLGGRLVAARADGPASVLGTVPQAGQALSLPVQVVGTNLDDLAAEGGSLTDVAENPFGATATIEADRQGTVTLAAGETSASVGLYEAPDRISVEPPFTIARVGGGSEIQPPPVPAHFRAIGWWNGPDGIPETGDDVRIGEVPATWSVDNSDEIAEEMQDADFAGTMQDNGIFVPALAGPNPERRYSTNNAGDLMVTASAGDLVGTARLVVTVQRFIDPPIR